MTGVLTKRTESQAVQMTLGGKGIAKKWSCSLSGPKWHRNTVRNIREAWIEQGFSGVTLTRKHMSNFWPQTSSLKHRKTISKQTSKKQKQTNMQTSNNNKIQREAWVPILEKARTSCVAQFLQRWWFCWPFLVLGLHVFSPMSAHVCIGESHSLGCLTVLVIVKGMISFTFFEEEKGL